MMKFDHLSLPVCNLERSRDWYVDTLGLKVEFAIAEERTVALNDGESFAIALQEKPSGPAGQWRGAVVPVEGVDTAHAQWTAVHGQVEHPALP